MPLTLNQRQLIIGSVKMKDRYLYKEVICGLSSNNDDEEKTLLEANQLVISKMKDEVGRFILHHYCVLKETPEYVINLLVTNNRVAVQTKTDDGNGNYPLHLSLRYGQSETVVLQILQTFKVAAQSIDGDGYYPLHEACIYKQSETVVLELLKAFPEAARYKSAYSWYPLHYACGNNQSAPVVLELLKVFPEAAQHQDNISRYPLHVACENNQSETVVHELIKLCPEAVKHNIYFGGYPLHLACANNAPLGVIKELVFHYPEALHVVAPNRRNKGPYDLACKPDRNKTPIPENVEYVREATTSREKTLRL